MPPDNEPDPEEVIVKTRYFASEEIDKSNLQVIQKEITRILQLEGYRQTDVDPLPFGPVQQTMDFRLFEGIPIEKNESLTNKAKNLFGSSSDRIRTSRDISESPMRLSSVSRTSSTLDSGTSPDLWWAIQ